MGRLVFDVAHIEEMEPVEIWLLKECKRSANFPWRFSPYNFSGLHGAKRNKEREEKGERTSDSAFFDPKQPKLYSFVPSFGFYSFLYQSQFVLGRRFEREGEHGRIVAREKTYFA